MAKAKLKSVPSRDPDNLDKPLSWHVAEVSPHPCTMDVRF